MSSSGQRVHLQVSDDDDWPTFDAATLSALDADRIQEHGPSCALVREIQRRREDFDRSSGALQTNLVLLQGASLGHAGTQQEQDAIDEEIKEALGDVVRRSAECLRSVTEYHRPLLERGPVRVRGQGAQAQESRESRERRDASWEESVLPRQLAQKRTDEKRCQVLVTDGRAGPESCESCRKLQQGLADTTRDRGTTASGASASASAVSSAANRRAASGAAAVASASASAEAAANATLAAYYIDKLRGQRLAESNWTYFESMDARLTSLLRTSMSSLNTRGENGALDLVRLAREKLSAGLPEGIDLDEHVDRLRLSARRGKVAFPLGLLEALTDISVGDENESGSEWDLE